MSLSLIHKPFIRQGLAITVAALLMNTAYAVTEQEELQQLRAEVNALRALIEQYVPQTREHTASTSFEAVVSPQMPVATVAVTPPAMTAKQDGLTLSTVAGSTISLYGFIRGDAQYQTAGGTSIFNRIDEVSLTGANDDKMFSSVATTRLGMDVNTVLDHAKVGGKVEVDFRGNNDSLRIRHAYLTYNNWLFGQTTSTFAATDLMPEMLDFNTGLGGTTHRTKMVRYQNQIWPQTEYFIGLEEANDGLATTKTSIPALTVKLKQGFAQGKGTSSLRGLLTERKTEDDAILSWGIGLGAAYQWTDQLRLMADYYHVEGDGKFVLYANDSYVVNPDTRQIYASVFDSFGIGATYQWNSKLRSTLGYGMMFADDDSAYAQQVLDNADTLQNRHLQQGWVNVMYNPVKPITVGLEYVYGERETFDQQKGRDRRIGAMAKYAF